MTKLHNVYFGRWILGAGLVAAFGGVFFLGNAVDKVAMNPWQIGLCATAMGLILIAIYLVGRRNEFRREETAKQFGELSEEMQESFAVLTTHLGAQFDQVKSAIHFSKGVTAVPPARGVRGGGNDSA